MGIYKRESCLCCECNYWSSYTVNHTELGLGTYNWGRCLKEKPAFSEMQKCEEFVCKENNNGN